MLKPKTLINIGIIIAAFGLITCNAPAEKTFDEHLAHDLQAALEDAVENPGTKFPGAVLYVSSPELGAWAGAAGIGNIDTDIPMNPTDKFRAGSIMKPFISSVVLQLMEEERLSLDDLMTAVLPDSVSAMFSDSNKITISMLLSHTSGIPDWLIESMYGEIAGNPQRIWEVKEYFKVSSALEPYFPPGEGWRYSNTNYNLLGLVIEKATGRSWREEIRERIIVPLELKDTLLPEPGDLSIPDYHARGYLDMGGKLVDFTIVDSSMAGAAGGQALITTTMDLASFFNALWAGDLFQNPATLDKMLSFVEVPEDVEVSRYSTGYGLGMMRFLLPGNIEMIGHAGGTAGFQSFIYFLPAQNLTISGMMSNMESDQYQILSPSLEILMTKYAEER